MINLIYCVLYYWGCWFYSEPTEQYSSYDENMILMRCRCTWPTSWAGFI